MNQKYYNYHNSFLNEPEKIQSSIYHSSIKIKKHIVQYRDTIDPGQKTNEEELTKIFLRELGHNRHMKTFSFTHSEECRNGADWIWVFLTEYGMFRFMVQAKYLRKSKTKITRKQVFYKTHANTFQVQQLIQSSKMIHAFPIYVLYSDAKKTFKCRNASFDTEEGVFFDSAENVFHCFSTKKHINQELNHFPISCLVSCFSRNCHYLSDRCKVCFHEGCRYLKACKKGGRYTPCKMPFQHLIQGLFHRTCAPEDLSNSALAIMFAPSVLEKNVALQKECICDLTKDAKNLAKNILITDYVNRHGQNYRQALLCNDMSVDNSVILCLEEIKNIVLKEWKSCPLFSRIGIFGSYARGTPRKESDIDLALVYNLEDIDSTERLNQLIRFFRNVCLSLHKNVDFVDYISENKNDPDFIKKINGDMIWLSIE